MTEIISYIPSRVKNAAVGGHVAGVEDIFDDDKGKDLKEINADVEDTLAFHQSQINALNSQNYVTVDSYSSLPATGAVDTVYRVSNWDGTQQDPSVYSEYAWNGEDYVHLSTKTQIGEIFDISAYHATGGVLAKYADLTAALGTNGANIPEAIRKGGMSVKFVLSSDNKYVQYRLMADEFTTDTTQWAIAEEGVYVENPEFVYVKTDKDNKILWAIKTDGGIYYGAGVPQQVVDYINEKIAELSLDEYEDIVAFLNGLEEGDKTLQTLLNEKVDKEEGKSLIDADYASTKSTIDNPEFLDVTLDADDKVLEGIQQDGTKVISGDLNVGGSSNINGDIRVLGNMEVSGVSYKVIENPEYLAAWVDADNKIIFGFKADGKTYVGDADFLDDIESIKAFLANFNDKNIDWDALTSITATENPEFMEVELDAEDKILGGRKVDGTKFENVGFETPKISIDKFSIKNINDTEGRLEVKIDKNNKVLSYRKSDGTLVENVGIETPKLKLTGNGLSELGEELKKGGYANLMDWSNETFIHIPMPDFAVVNFICDKKKESITAKSGLGTAGVDCEIPAYMEFWDKSGNYFKKPVEISAQGSSSMNYYIKNNAIDITDGSEIKFGNLIAQDSFHLKKYYQDVFRGQCIVAYHLMEQIYKTRPAGECRPWDYLNTSTAAFGSGNLNADFNNAALAHPDGFPFKMYWNGEYSGVYCFNLKKHRANYNMKKNEYKKIILDGEIGIDEFWGGTIDWTAFEIRNPKDLYYAPYDQLSATTKAQIDNGHISKYKTVDNVRYYKYDGDYPDILTDNSDVDSGVSAFVRGSIERLAGSVPSIDAASTAEEKRTLFNKYFIKDFFIDYVVASEVLYHWDGFRKNWIWCIWDAEYDSQNEEYTGHWTPTLYDCDSIFGITFNGTEFINTDGTGHVSKGFGRQPALVCNELYNSDIYIRYSELVSAGIFTVNNIIGLINSWLGRIGYENFEEEVSYVESLSCEIPSYRDGSLTYSRYPTQGGCYNSIKRVTEWLKLRLPWLTSNLNQ